MSAVLDLLKGLNTVAEYRQQLHNIRAELKDEIILNIKYLKDVEVGKEISENRLRAVINNLDIEELNAYLTSRFPKGLISRKKVTKDLVGDISAKRLLGKDCNVDFEELCRRIRRMIKYIQKDFDGLSKPKYNALNIKNYLKIARKLI